MYQNEVLWEIIVLFIVGVPTLKMIQAARTKVLLLAGIVGKHCRKINTYRTSAVGAERREEINNTNSHCGGWNETIFQLTGITCMTQSEPKRFTVSENCVCVL